MKKIYLLLSCLIAIQASAQWTQVGTAFTGSARGMYFFDENNGVAVGGDNATTGYVALTSDGGTTWTSTSVGGTTLLRAVTFLNADTGFTCGQAGTIFKTTDGGATWINIYTDINPLQYFRAVKFISSSVGLIGGAGGTVLKTSDGGTTWTTITLSETTSDVIQLQMADENTGYLVAANSTFLEGYVFKTTDGGDTWTQVNYSSGGGFLALTVIDDQTAYVGGNGQTILKTTDGGTTWSTVYTGTAGTSFRSAAHTSEGAVYLADDGTGAASNGSIASSTDGGATWNDTSFTGIIWLNITFPTQYVGYASNTIGGIYKLSIPPPPPPQWTLVGSPFIGFVRGLFFTSVDVGYAVGGDGATTGYISKTTDGGVSWTSTSFTQSNLLRSADFINSDTGFVSGSSGVLFETTDAGSTWNLIYTGVGQYFRAVDFVSSQVGFLAGAAGTILKTTDGGTTFTTYNLGETTSDVIQLHMVDASTGYAICSAGLAPFANGYVFKTTDGGDTWTQVYFDAATGFLGLAVGNAQTVYAGGLNQTIIKTSDGGTTWSAAYTGLVGPSIRCGFAPSVDKVFFADDQNNVINTNDGSTWNDTLLSSLSGLYAMHFPESTVGYVGDGAGNVYKIILPCQSVSSPTEIIGNTTTCSGNTESFSVAAVDGAEYYSWSLPEGSTIVSGDGTDSITVLIGTNSGTISVSASNDCDTSGATTMDITVNITPAIPTITFNTGVLTSSAASGNQWYYNGTEIPGATDQNYTATQNGDYYVIVTQDGCSSQSEPYTVIGVGINSITNEVTMTITPNPMNQSAQINISATDAKRLIISDVQGKLIINVPVTSSQFVLNKEDFSVGMYMVQLMNDKNELISRTKLIVQ